MTSIYYVLYYLLTVPDNADDQSGLRLYWSQGPSLLTQSQLEDLSLQLACPVACCHRVPEFVMLLLLTFCGMFPLLQVQYFLSYVLIHTLIVVQCIGTGTGIGISKVFFINIYVLVIISILDVLNIMSILYNIVSLQYNLQLSHNNILQLILLASCYYEGSD